MRSLDRSSDLVEYLYETSVNPERLFDLIEEWDARISGSDPELAVRVGGFCNEPFVRHVERALEILDEFGAFEFRRLDDLLAGMPTASMVLTDTGVVVSANEPARAAFGSFPGGSIRLMPLAAAEFDDLTDRVAAVALGPKPRDDVVQLRPEGRERPLLLHLRTLDSGRVRRHTLAVSTEHVWHDEAGGVLSRVFALTGAEIGLVRALTAGETVGDVARAHRRGGPLSTVHPTVVRLLRRPRPRLARQDGGPDPEESAFRSDLPTGHMTGSRTTRPWPEGRRADEAAARRGRGECPELVVEQSRTRSHARTCLRLCAREAGGSRLGWNGHRSAAVVERYAV